MSWNKLQKRKYRKRGKGKSSISRQIKSEINKSMKYMVEKKYQDTTQVAAAVDYNGVVKDLMPVVRGTSDAGQRIGDEITLAGVHADFSFVRNDATQLCRFLIVQWHETGTPLVAQILASTGLPTSVNAAYNHDNGHRFTILCDKTFAMDAVSRDVSHGKCTLNLSGKLPYGFKNKVNYAGGTSVGENKLFSIQISDSSAAAHPTVTAFARVTYRDA